MDVPPDDAPAAAPTDGADRGPVRNDGPDTTSLVLAAYFVGLILLVGALLLLPAVMGSA